jgi:superfamily II RNA helicase
MPARTVIFDELRKFYGRFHANLKTRDFYQMAGRAGRRGIDIEGFVYSRINPNFITHEEILKIVEGDPEKVYSRFNASYATIINLYKRLGNELFDIYPLSFHHYQQKRRKRERALGAMRSKLDVLEQLGYIRTDTGTLTEKGEFAGKLYGYELGLTELYYNGLLDGLSDKELAVLALAAVFEPRKGTKVPKYSKVLRRMMKDTGSIIKNIHRIERKNGFKKGITKEYYFHLSPCISAWMDGEDFGDSLRFTDADEGEIIRYFRMGLQVLREILDTPASKDIKQKVRQAIHKIDRDIVDAESQLRE